jgi:hypothetical protein
LGLFFSMQLSGQSMEQYGEIAWHIRTRRTQDPQLAMRLVQTIFPRVYHNFYIIQSLRRALVPPHNGFRHAYASGDVRRLCPYHWLHELSRSCVRNHLLRTGVLSRCQSLWNREKYLFWSSPYISTISQLAVSPAL